MLRAIPQDMAASEDADPVVGTASFGGTTPAALLHLGVHEDGTPKKAEVIAIRALHGQSERTGANLEHAQPRVTEELASDLVGLFHSTTMANLPSTFATWLEWARAPWHSVLHLPTMGREGQAHATLECRSKIQRDDNVVGAPHIPFC